MNESPQPNVIGSGGLRSLSPTFWLLVAVTGMVAGLCGGLLMRLLELIQHSAWPYAQADDFLGAVGHSSATRILLVVSSAGVLVTIVRLALRSVPGGHGGEVAERIWFAAGRLDPTRTIVRAVLAIVIVGMGASLGREAAPKQLGALAGGLFARWRRLPDPQQRLLVACGAGAGIAAVYNVPLGGALFALEVLLGTISLSLVPPALLAAMIATATSWILLPIRTTYSIVDFPVRSDVIAWAALAGPVLGLASVGYIKLISWADGIRPTHRGWLLVALPTFGMLACAALYFPQLLGNGKGLVQRTLSEPLAPLVLLCLVFLKPLATAACLGCGAPGGLFTPTLTFGALIGALLGAPLLHFWPGAEPGAFALIGACAVLAASTQGPVSAAVLCLELTGHVNSFLVPMLLATSGAVYVSRRLEGRSIYSGRVHMGRRGASQPAASNTDGVAVISSAARFAELAQKTLAAARRGQCLRVIDADGTDLGNVATADVAHPPGRTLPLEVASAADFVELQRGAKPAPALRQV